MFSFFLFLGFIMAYELVHAAEQDTDGDGFPDTVDKCPTSYGLVEGCFEYTPSMAKQTVTAENIVLPTCTDPATCKCTGVTQMDMAIPGDVLLLQIKGTTYVSKPFEVSK